MDSPYWLQTAPSPAGPSPARSLRLGWVGRVPLPFPQPRAPCLRHVVLVAPKAALRLPVGALSGQLAPEDEPNPGDRGSPRRRFTPPKRGSQGVPTWYPPMWECGASCPPYTPSSAALTADLGLDFFGAPPACHRRSLRCCCPRCHCLVGQRSGLPLVRDGVHRAAGMPSNLPCAPPSPPQTVQSRRIFLLISSICRRGIPNAPGGRRFLKST